MHDLHYEIYIAGTPQAVWNALTKPEGVKQLYYGSVIESDFRVGGDMAYVGPGRSGDKTVHIFGKILEFTPGEVFSHSCKVGTAYGDEHAKFESRITYRLEPIGGTTKLTVVHDRWQEGNPSYDGTKAGWWMILSSLKSLVETGKPLDFTTKTHE